MAKNPTPPANNDAANTNPDAATPQKVKVRVLSHCAHGAVNAVAELDASQLGEAKAAGLVDDDPAAVAYAEGLARPASGDDALTA